MTNQFVIWAGFLTTLMATAGCGGVASPEEGEGEGGEARHASPLGADKPAVTPHPGGTPPFEVSVEHWLSATPDALAWTSTNDLAIIDGKTGAVLELRPTADLGGARDLIYDPWQARAVVFEGTPDEQSGEIASYDVEKTAGGPHMLPRLHEGWVDGDARLLASPLGVVVFEQSYGERWKVLFSDEETSTSVPAPLPASAWIRGGEREFTLHALTYTDPDLLYRRAAGVKWGKIASPATSGLNVTQVSSPPTARMINAPARGDALLFDVKPNGPLGDEVVVRVVTGPSAGPPSSIPLGASGQRIEAAIAVDGGEVALLLISGDSRVLGVETDGAGAVIHTDVLFLPGDVRQETRFFSHDLAALGSRHALAATNAGVFSIKVERSAAGVHLSLEPSFDGSLLRGPVAAISPKPL